MSVDVNKMNRQRLSIEDLTFISSLCSHVSYVSFVSGQLTNMSINEHPKHYIESFILPVLSLRWLEYMFPRALNCENQTKADKNGHFQPKSLHEW